MHWGAGYMVLRMLLKRERPGQIDNSGPEWSPRDAQKEKKMKRRETIRFESGGGMPRGVIR